jgi:hypothetical protein
MEECDVVTGLRGVLADMPADSSNGVLCGIIDELKCDVVLIGGIRDEITEETAEKIGD